MLYKINILPSSTFQTKDLINLLQERPLVLNDLLLLVLKSNCLFLHGRSILVQLVSVFHDADVLLLELLLVFEQLLAFAILHA